MKAREVMTKGAECIDADRTVGETARKMAELDVGALPICGVDDRLKGMITDRDIVVRVIAEGLDPEEVLAGDLGLGEPFTVEAEASVEEVISTMADKAVRRLPVIEDHRLVGIVSQKDLARAIEPSEAGHLVEAVSATG